MSDLGLNSGHISLCLILLGLCLGLVGEVAWAAPATPKVGVEPVLSRIWPFRMWNSAGALGLQPAQWSGDFDRPGAPAGW
jgi:hypothetical protein